MTRDQFDLDEPILIGDFASERVQRLCSMPDYVSRSDTTPEGPEPDPNDVWAFTDPDALDAYRQRGQLRQPEQDVRFEVMRAGPWQLSISGRVYPFHTGDEVVFQCRMERDEAGDDPGPVLIARLEPADRPRLCGDMSGAMKGKGMGEGM